MRVAGLRVHGIPCDKRYDLLPLFFDHMFALFSREMYLPFFNDSAGNSIEGSCMKYFFQGFVRRPCPP
jgi:hypothetical protein